MMDLTFILLGLVIVAGVVAIFIIENRTEKHVAALARMVAVMRTMQYPADSAVAPAPDTGRLGRATDDVMEKLQGENQWLAQENKRLTEEHERLRNQPKEVSEIMTAADIDFVRKLMEPKKPSSDHERLTMWRP